MERAFQRGIAAVASPSAPSIGTSAVLFNGRFQRASALNLGGVVAGRRNRPSIKKYKPDKSAVQRTHAGNSVKNATSTKRASPSSSRLAIELAIEFPSLTPSSLRDHRHSELPSECIRNWRVNLLYSTVTAINSF